MSKRFIPWPCWSIWGFMGRTGTRADRYSCFTLTILLLLPPPSRTCRRPAFSTITADEIRKNPVARDVSEIIRTMPGVNLTGNSTSGQRGNNRQIDIRGMGPENTR